MLVDGFVGACRVGVGDADVVVGGVPVAEDVAGRCLAGAVLVGGWRCSGVAVGDGVDVIADGQFVDGVDAQGDADCGCACLVVTPVCRTSVKRLR